jgi:hypothetical protein
VQLRLETGIVPYPHHYCDDDGKEIWEMVVGFLGQKRAGGQDPAHGLAWHGATAQPVVRSLSAGSATFT